MIAVPLAGSLAAALATPRALAKAGTLPHHRAVRLTVQGNTLALHSCNGLQEVHGTLDVQTEGPLDCWVASEALAAVVGRMDGSRAVKVSRADGHLVLVQGKRRVRLPEEPDSETVELLPSGRGGPWVRVPRERLRALLTAAVAYTIDDPTLPSFAGVSLDAAGDWLRVSALTGHRAFLARERVEGVGVWSALLSVPVVERWRALLASSRAEHAELRASKVSSAEPSDACGWSTLDARARRGGQSDRVALRVEGTTLVAATLAAEPAGVGALIEAPSYGTHVVARVDLAGALSALRALALTAREDEKIFPTLEARAQDAAIALRTEGGGSTEETLDASVVREGKATDRAVAVNVKYLLGALETADQLSAEDVDIAWGLEARGAASSSWWIVRPAGSSLEDAPWWTLTMGLSR